MIIAGAGPVGLFLACELGLRDLRVLVLEREADASSSLKRLPFGRRGLSPATAEAFDRRGMLEQITALQEGPAGGLAGHFAGIALDYDKIKRFQWKYRLPGPSDTSLMVTMEQLENLLTRRALDRGVEILRGFEVEACQQKNGEVTVSAAGDTFRAGWLVGCDGGRSRVRKLAGFEFTGSPPEFTGYSVQVELAEPHQLKLGRHHTATGMYYQMRPGTIAMAYFDGGASHGQPTTREQVESVLRHVSQTELSLTALKLATTWTDRAFQATCYRLGRVLLAGDAAHIHSPLGGQGLNLGLGDALNLGWKLAAVVRGQATEELLDTYTRERHPVGAQILDWSRAQVALMRPSPSSRALEAIVRDLVDTEDGATYFAERVWGLALRYDLGHSHPLVGRSAPDFELAEGHRLAELLRGGAGALLNFEGDEQLDELGRRLGDKLAYWRGQANQSLGLSSLLVRPDGIVAWACEGKPVMDEVVAVLSQWLKTG